VKSWIAGGIGLPMTMHRIQYPASGVSRKRIEKCRRIGNNTEVIGN
jgi:hypothetical protein